MATPAIPDLAIRSLGERHYPSPFAFGANTGGRRVDFASDDHRILFDLDPRAVQSFLAENPGAAPPSLEVAGPREKLYFRPPDVRAAVVTAGGLCPGINDVVRSLVMTLSHHYGVDEVLGVRYGLRGLVEQDAPPVKLNPDVVEDIHRLGGSFLGSSRGSPPVEGMVRFLDREALSMLFLIGGDGTQRAARAISHAARAAGLGTAIIGIPKTVDNDIAFVDQTFGFATAVSYARAAIDAAHAEAKGAYNGVGLVRLMGRDSGFIAAQAALASGEANFVLIPEVPFELDGPQGFLTTLQRRIQARQHAVVVVAEGAGQEFLEQERAGRGKDASGNEKLGDIGRYLRDRISRHFADRQIPVALRYMDPGYTIRSAPAEAGDAVYCQELGQNAVHAAMAGKTEMLVGLVHGKQVHVPIEAVAAARKRLDPVHPLWRAVLQATGQPERMGK